MFAKHGFHNAKVEDIASGAGVGKGTVYEYFSSKRQLFEKLFVAAIEESLENIRREIVNCQGGLNKLQRVAQLNCQHVFRSRDLTRVTLDGHGQLDKELRKWLFHMEKERAAILRQIIDEGIANKEFRADLARLRVVLSGLMPERANLAARLAAREESSSHSRMLTTNLTNTQARIQAVLAGLKALYLEQSQVRLDSVTFEQLKGELLREKACLEAESERLNTDIADLGDPNSRQQFWADALEQLIACPTLSRELVNALIDYIEIGEKLANCQEVVLHYNFRKG